MCRRCELFLLTFRNVLRVALFRSFLPIIFFIAAFAWGQDASTGALRGVG